MGSGFHWVVSPEIIAKNLEDYGTKIEVAVRAVAIRWGQEIQDQARLKEHWKDRSGAARGGLFFAVDGFGMGEVIGEIDEKAKALMSDVEVVEGDRQTLIIILGHTVYYGKFLEISNGGKHAVIMSTIEENLPMLDRMVREVLT